MTSNLLDALQVRSWPETCVLSRTVKTDIHIAQWHLERNCFLVYFSKFDHFTRIFWKSKFCWVWVYIYFLINRVIYIWFRCFINKKITFYCYIIHETDFRWPVKIFTNLHEGARNRHKKPGIKSGAVKWSRSDGKWGAQVPARLQGCRGHWSSVADQWGANQVNGKKRN